MNSTHRSLKLFWTVRPQICEKGRWFLFVWCPPTHSAITVKCFLANHGVKKHHPSYSPSLRLADFIPFAKVKNSLKGKRLLGMEDKIKKVFNWVILLKFLSPTNAPLYYTYKMLKYTVRLSHDRSYMFWSTWTIIREPMPNLAKVTILWN